MIECAGKHLSLLGIHPSDTRDHRMRGVFHGYALQTLLWGIARPGSYFTRALYPPGPDCCSPRSISFSTSEPDKMYTVNYMLYHLHVYTRPGIYGNGSAPTPMPEEEVKNNILFNNFVSTFKKPFFAFRIFFQLFLMTINLQTGVEVSAS